MRFRLASFLLFCSLLLPASVSAQVQFFPPLQQTIFVIEDSPEGRVFMDVGILLVDRNSGKLWQKRTTRAINTGWVDLGSGSGATGTALSFSSQFGASGVTNVTIASGAIITNAALISPTLTLGATNTVALTDTYPVITSNGTRAETLSDLMRSLKIDTLVDLGTIANGGTATLVLATNYYKAAFSGATATIALPTISSITNSHSKTIYGTNTSGGSQIITIPSLLRGELGTGVLVTTITNNTGAGFRITFDSVAGAWRDVSAIGDALSFSTFNGSTSTNKSPLNFRLTEVAATTLSPGGYSAFPNLYVFASGKIMCVFRSGTDHFITRDGVIKQIYSLDGGFTWSSPVTIASEASTELGNFGGGVCANNRIVIFYPRLTTVDLSDQYIYSDDEGVAWSSPVTVSTGVYNVYANYGKLINVASNQVMMPWYGIQGTTNYTPQVRISSDFGLTWGASISVISSLGASTPSYTEATYAYLGGGKILGLIRMDDVTSMKQVLSSDNGNTWSSIGNITFDSSASGMTPWLETFISPSGKRVVVCYYNNRDANRVRAVYGYAANLINNGVSGWISSSVADQLTLTDGYAAGYPTAIHPNDTQFGLGMAYDDTSSTAATLKFFIPALPFGTSPILAGTNIVLTTNGNVITINNSATGTAATVNPTLATYAAGTAYSLTATSAALDFGTTDPTLTIAAAGSYLLMGRVNLKYNGATFSANRTITLKLRRTNNTALDVADSTTVLTTDITTTKTENFSICQIPPVRYTTTAANDVITLFGDVSVVPTAGSLDATEASIVAISIPAIANTVNTAVFDGSNDYIGKDTAMTGIADGKVFTCSFWIKPGADGVLAYVFETGTTSQSLFSIAKSSGNFFTIIGKNAATTIILNVSSTTGAITAASGWNHVYICMDLTDTAKRKIYINGVAQTLSIATYSNDTIDLQAATPRTRIGALPNAASMLNASLAEFWFDDTYFDDPTKFYSAGHPVYLGATGQVPTGTAPAAYYSQSGSGNTWATDSSGNGNTLTVTGALTTDTSP